MEHLDGALIEKTWRFCRGRLNNSADAEDLAQDILCEALKALRAGREIGSFYPWYWAMAKNRLNIFLRLRQNGAAALEACGGAALPSGSVPEDDILAGEEESALNRAVSRLSALHRQVIILFYLRGLGVGEISKELSVPEGTIKRRLHDAREDIRKGVENMKEHGRSSYAPAEVQLWGGYSIPSYWDKISDILSKQIFAICAKTARSAREIADEIGVSPVYFEEKLAWLLKNGFVREGPAGRYLTDFCLYPARIYNEFWYELSGIYESLGPELTEAIKERERDIRALDFYGNAMPLPYLMWILYVYACDMFSRSAMEIYTSKWQGKIPENNGKSYRVAGTVLWPDEKFEPKGRGRPVAWSNLHASFRTSGYRNVEHANLFQAEPFGDRDKIITEANADLFMRIYDDPFLSLSPTQEEAAAEFLKKGYLEKKNGGLYPAMPVMSYETREEIFEILKDAAAPLAFKYAGEVGALGERLLLPETRKDLLEEFVRWIMSGAFFPAGYVLRHGMDSGELELPGDYGAGAAGIAVYVRK